MAPSVRSLYLSALAVWLFRCSPCAGGHSSNLSECPALLHKPPELPLRDMGGLTALINSAESTRDAVVGGDLPYNFIREQAREAYNSSRHLSTAIFVNEWASYTQNSLFVAGFVLFVGILLPGIAMALWTFCECCYEEDEEEEEVNRNLTWQAQVVVWSLAVAVVAVLLVLVVSVGLLVAGSCWVSEGVDRGSTVVRRAIPQLMEIKHSGLQSLEEILVEGYENMTQELQSTILDHIPHNVSTSVSGEHLSSAERLTDNINDTLVKRPHLLDLAVSITKTLGSLHTLTTSLSHSLTLLQHTCNQTQDGNASAIGSLCDNYTTLLPTLVPISHWNKVGGVSEDGDHSFLATLRVSLDDPVFDVNPRPWPQQLFLSYLDTLVQNLSWYINSTSELYFASLGHNLSNFTEEVALFYNSSLPLSSQPQVELYLGPRHLESWQWFRSALTTSLAVLIFFGCLCVIGALARGLYNVSAIYLYSDNSPYDHGAHQAGLLLKKLAFSLSVVCVLSAAFSGFFLSVAGVMGKVCGNHNNFSELLNNVIDNPHTWSGDNPDDNPFYPLASAVLDLPEFPLTVADTLDACRSNASLFRAFHLEQRYDLQERILLNPLERRTYSEDMQRIYLRLEGANLVSPLLELWLQQLLEAAAVPVQWEELTGLANLPPSSLFQPDFVGFAELRTVLDNLASVAAESESSFNISDIIVTALDSLNQLDMQLQPSLFNLRANSTQLQRSLSKLPRLSASLSELVANTTLTARRSSNLLVTLDSEAISRRMELYLNTSITNLTCHVGNCHSVATDYNTFAAALCGDVVPGMDLYWTLLLITLSVSVVLVFLLLLLASRFVSLEMQKSNRKNTKFYLKGAVLSQIRSTVWQVVSLAVYIWWVVYVSQDKLVRQEFCGEGQSGCCAKCVWVFGTVFLLTSAGVGGVSRIYQYFTVYMIKKCKAMKYRRFWIERKKAVNFYGQLALLCVQDLPFLILIGVTTDKTFLSVPTFYGLVMSLSGILAYLVYMVGERRNMAHYWTWLRVELGKMGLGKGGYNTNPEALPNANGSTTGRVGANHLMNGLANPVRFPHESSGSDHSENSSQGTYGFEFHQPRLSDIPEYPEGSVDAGGHPARVAGPPRIVPIEPRLLHDDRQTDSEMSERNSPFQSRVGLDGNIDQDSEAYRQRRRYAIDNFERGGVEVAPTPYYRPEMDASTISGSYRYGSRNSMEMHGYMSGSQAPDSNSNYESSDYRDEDAGSVYSQARYRLPVPSFMGEVTVDV